MVFGKKNRHDLIEVFKDVSRKVNNSTSGSSWTDPLSPRPLWFEFLPVRPHKESYKVS